MNSSVIIPDGISLGSRYYRSFLTDRTRTAPPDGLVLLHDVPVTAFLRSDGLPLAVPKAYLFSRISTVVCRKDEVCGVLCFADSSISARRTAEKYQQMMKACLPEVPLFVYRESRNPDLNRTMDADAFTWIDSMAAAERPSLYRLPVAQTLGPGDEDSPLCRELLRAGMIEAGPRPSSCPFAVTDYGAGCNLCLVSSPAGRRVYDNVAVTEAALPLIETDRAWAAGDPPFEDVIALFRLDNDETDSGKEAFR